ncbi:MAG: IMP dehydrogenase [Planctomycetota bacterium]
MEDLNFPTGITFDDVLLVPRYSEILPSQVDTTANLTNRVKLGIPLVSAAMDTVTEARLAIAIAQEGGIGIIHKNLTIEQQAREVFEVKRSANGVIRNPVSFPPDATISSARQAMHDYNISGIPIVDSAGKAVGIVTRRDLSFQEQGDRKLSEIMTRTLVTAPVGTTLSEARSILNSNKVEKLILLNPDGSLGGLITMKDISKIERYPKAARDIHGRLIVGAAVGVYDFERVEALVKADADIIVVDTAHGHSKGVGETVREIKKRYDIDVVAGNIASREAAKFLMDQGADAIKVGIGPGSICTTRVIAGIGVPQLSAIFECFKATQGSVPIIADGGIKFSGDIVKALAAGASCVMIGSLFAGTDESPGEIIFYRGRSFKSYRGMGSLGAMVSGSADRYGQAGAKQDKLVPEGIEGRVPAKGPLADYVYQLVGGLRAGMGYVGASNLSELQAKAEFIRITHASLIESHPHDITITRAAPNYRQESYDSGD